MTEKDETIRREQQLVRAKERELAQAQQLVQTKDRELVQLRQQVSRLVSVPRTLPPAPIKIRTHFN